MARFWRHPGAAAHPLPPRYDTGEQSVNKARTQNLIDLLKSIKATRESHQNRIIDLVDRLFVVQLTVDFKHYVLALHKNWLD